ncbi:hypothetical protein ACFX13_017281 [Malus domestica]
MLWWPSSAYQNPERVKPGKNLGRTWRRKEKELSRNVTYATNNCLLQGIKLSRSGPLISHNLFADDSLFFLRATEKNCRKLMDLFADYCMASGQSINYEKSSLFFSTNTPVELSMAICEILRVLSTVNPGKYLGLPSIWGRSKRGALGYVKRSNPSKDPWMEV